MKKIISYQIIFSLVMTNLAYAYLDPGTGSFLLQIIALIFAGVVTFFKFFYTRVKEILKKIKMFFLNLFKKLI